MTTELQIEVSQLRNTQERTAIVLESISQNIGAISAVEQSLSKIIAVHEEKFRHQDKINADFAKALEKVSTESREMFKESKKELAAFREEVLGAITSLRTDTLNSTKENETNRDTEVKALTTRVEVLERWRYYIMGMIVIASWAINHAITWFGSR